MKKMTSIAAVLLLSMSVLAQDTRLVLPDGTPVRLRTTENLSSHDAVKGGTVDFEVMEDIYAQNVLVVKKSSSAIGTITDAQRKRTMGRSGKLDITIDYVRLLNGEKAQLRGVKQGNGGGHTGAMVGAMVATSLIVWPAAPLFLFMHGKDINIAKGTPITAYVDGDFSIGQNGNRKPVRQLEPPAEPVATSGGGEQKAVEKSRGAVAPEEMDLREKMQAAKTATPTQSPAPDGKYPHYECTEWTVNARLGVKECTSWVFN